MRVTVDKDKCQGHARCYATCPEVFELDDVGFAITSDRLVEPEFEEQVRIAEQCCPELAIIIEE